MCFWVFLARARIILSTTVEHSLFVLIVYFLNFERRSQSSTMSPTPETAEESTVTMAVVPTVLDIIDSQTVSSDAPTLVSNDLVDSLQEGAKALVTTVPNVIEVSTQPFYSVSVSLWRSPFSCNETPGLCRD